MWKAEAVREEIGFLKLVFGILIALDASLIAWSAQSFTTASGILLVGAWLSLAGLSLSVVWVTRLIYRRIRFLETL